MTRQYYLVNEFVSPSSRREWIEILVMRTINNFIGSPSSRREWIEMVKIPFSSTKKRSPSSRREWIEIMLNIKRAKEYKAVSLLTEGVD